MIKIKLLPLAFFFCASFFSTHLLSAYAEERTEILHSSENISLPISPISISEIKAYAKSLADNNYISPSDEDVELFEDFDIEEWQSIQHKEEKFLWKDENLPFALEFFAPGYLHQDSIEISIIEDEQSKKLQADRSLFSASSEDIIDDLPKEFNIGGFRIHYSSQNNMQNIAQYSGIASFIGATFFRGTGKNAQSGVYARGVTINTALQEGEEFPHFTHIWIVKPKKNDSKLTFYALMDSPSMTGVFTFILETGTSTIINVENTFYPRAGKELPQKIGIAPLASMFFASSQNEVLTEEELDEERNIHNAHNSDGLLYLDSSNNYVWRSLENPRRLSITSINNNNPSGFGLFQRNIDENSFHNKQFSYHKSSSLWIEPLSNWGNGYLELIEIPTRNDKHNNIALFWVPYTFGEQAISDEVSYSYKLYWITAGASPHLLAKVVSAKEIHADENDRLCTFTIDFKGEALNALPENTGLASVIELPKEVEFVDKTLTKDNINNTWKLTFSVLLPTPESIVQTLIPARNPEKIRFKAHLIRGENLPTPLTEIWQYDLTL